MMWIKIVISVAVLCGVSGFTSGDFDPFADNVLFSLNWQGLELVDAPPPEDLSDANTMMMTTKDNEKYKCIIPDVLQQNSQSDIDSYKGPDELTILNQLFTQTSCSYRIESYWTYELCHGRYLRQYHEEKEPGKKAKLQEYYLGHYKPAPAETLSPPTDPVLTGGVTTPAKSKQQAKLQKVEGIEIPYFAINFTEGTKCDLTNTPRRTSVHYVCQEEGKGEVYSLKEISTCEYEVVVLTNLLCDHPAYKMKKEPVNQIQCHSLPGSPRRPRSLDNLELENTNGRFNFDEMFGNDDDGDEEGDDDDDDDDDDDNDDEEEDWEEKDAEDVDVDLEDAEEAQQQAQREAGVKKKAEKSEEAVPSRTRTETNIGTNTDKQLLTQFLNGDYCIQGGSGWWKHEFCYGKHITQFHEEKGVKTVILLGQWNKVRHIEWMKDNPLKKPKPPGQRKGVSHFYGSGDHCDLNGKKRWTEVKLKCKEYPNQPHAVAIYLVEPSPCEYSLVVESPILCPLIEQADSNGLIEQL